MSTNNSLGEFPPMSPPPHYSDEEEDEITPVPLSLDGDASLSPSTGALLSMVLRQNCEISE